uniref:Angiopoietin-4 n=1 Tax=Ascaris suum TaxID=6253 RepID=F1L435_ASCSU
MIHPLIFPIFFPLSFANTPLSTEYQGHLEGRCEGGFDCDPQGPLTCVPLSAIRDCIADCPNRADEKCGTNAVLCDERVQNGCGKCVRKELVDTYCSDHRWRNLCDEPEHFRCATTENCVLPEWLNDGVNDCADGSDEDPCLTGRGICINGTRSSTMVTSPNPSFTTEVTLEGHKGKCVEGEFRCENGNECLPIAYVLDGIAQCSDKSDEEFCTKFESNCPDQKRPCSFNADIGLFTCGCPAGTRRTTAGICTPANLPPNPGDCADLQRLYKSSRSGVFTAYDWKCANPALCKFSVHCDMEIFGGGWTIILQRMNMSVNFDRDMADYENGFAIDNANFWIGIDRLHRLTNRPQCANELLLRLQTSSDAHTILVRYSHFIVCEPSTGYRLNLGLLFYSNDLNLKDELSETRLSPFEGRPKWACAEGGAWWRRRCGQQGVLTGSNRAEGKYPGVTWNGKRLSAIQMMIRPRAYIPPSKGLRLSV